MTILGQERISREVAGFFEFNSLTTSCDSRRHAATSATIVDQFSHVKDFFAEQAKDLKPGVGVLMQHTREFLARNEVYMTFALGLCRQAVRFTGERGGKTYDKARTHGSSGIRAGHGVQ